MVFDGRNPNNVLKSFFAYNLDFTGRVRVGSADLNGDGRSEIITGAGPRGGPQVGVFDGLTNKVLQDSFEYDPTFLGGVFVG